MNLILVSESDLISPNRVRLSDRRHGHILSVHRAQLGDKLRVGLIGGKMGSGVVAALSSESVELEIALHEDPPPPLALTLFLALPRPKFLIRVLQAVSSLGVKELYLFNSYRVDKIYWSCDQLTPESVRDACLLGLEQARDTILPTVHLKRRFKPFVEDEVPSLIQSSTALIAHPTATTPCPYAVAGSISLVIGPEGGFIPFEVDKLSEAGFTPVRLTERILKVETAISTLIGRLT